MIDARPLSLAGSVVEPGGPPTPRGRPAPPLRVLDLFAGLGGFSLGLERTGGFETVAFCEIEPFCRRVLAKHWPEVKQYDDVRTLTAERLAADGIAVDVITGGFPCQDISVAGKQAGIADDTRSGLWSEIARLVGELRPRYVLVENVANLLAGPSEQPGGWFGRVLGDLAALGYDAEWHCIPASAVGAHHRRDRTWILAYAARIGGDGGEHSEHRCQTDIFIQTGRKSRALAHADSPPSWKGCGDYPRVGRKLAAGVIAARRAGWAPEPDVGRVADGVPARVDRLRSLGNAVVPAIPEIIGRAILAAEGVTGTAGSYGAIRQPRHGGVAAVSLNLSQIGQHVRQDLADLPEAGPSVVVQGSHGPDNGGITCAKTGTYATAIGGKRTT